MGVRVGADVGSAEMVGANEVVGAVVGWPVGGWMTASSAAARAAAAATNNNVRVMATTVESGVRQVEASTTS